MRGAQFGIKTGDNDDQKRTAERFRPRLLPLCLSGFAVALDERIGKGCAQQMAMLWRDDDKAPRRDLSVIWSRARRVQNGLDLLGVGPRIAQAFGRNMLVGMN